MRFLTEADCLALCKAWDSESDYLKPTTDEELKPHQRAALEALDMSREAGEDYAEDQGAFLDWEGSLVVMMPDAWYARHPKMSGCTILIGSDGPYSPVFADYSVNLPRFYGSVADMTERENPLW